MGSAVSLRDDFDGAELRRLAKRSRDGPQSRRLLALAEIYDGGRRRDAARIGDDFLRGPHDLTIDAAGRLLVADSGNDRTLIFRLAGRKGQWAGVWAGEQASPEGVAAAADGRVYVTNAGLDTVLALEKGRIVKRAGGRGRGENQYIRPHDIHVDGQGRILVVDPGNNRIQILDRDLGFRSMLAGKAYGFYEPKYVTHDKDGMVYVADEYNNRVLVLDPSHTPVGVYGGVRGTGPGQLNKPEGVEAAGPKLWVSDTYNDRILLLKRP